MSLCPLNAKKTHALSELCGIEFDRVLCHSDGVWAEARSVGEVEHFHVTVNRRTGSVYGHWNGRVTTELLASEFEEPGGLVCWTSCSDVPPRSLSEDEGHVPA